MDIDNRAILLLHRDPIEPDGRPVRHRDRDVDDALERALAKRFASCIEQARQVDLLLRVRLGQIN